MEFARAGLKDLRPYVQKSHKGRMPCLVVLNTDYESAARRLRRRQAKVEPINILSERSVSFVGERAAQWI